jgi:hypothetical protein
MSAEDTIDDIVDKVIDEVLNKSDSDLEEIKKRRPKPFRYLTDEKEIEAELTSEEPTPVSVMKEPTAAKIVDEKLAVIGLGDVDAIENVLRRHEASRKIIEK